ncbi:SET domain-containing protein 4 [Massospora cicadina]|nr:SET domain-containing protein 4 [Massospora cicadina]
MGGAKPFWVKFRSLRFDPSNSHFITQTTLLGFIRLLKPTLRIQDAGGRPVNGPGRRVLAPPLASRFWLVAGFLRGNFFGPSARLLEAATAYGLQKFLGLSLPVHTSHADLGTGRGMKACVAIEPGDKLVTIPPQLLIGWPLIAAKHGLRSVPAIPPHLLLTLYILAQASLGEGSWCHPYISTLPETFPTLEVLYLYKTKVLPLVPPLARERVRLQRTRIGREFAELRSFAEQNPRFVERLGGGYPNRFTAGSFHLGAFRVGRDRFLWAWLVVNTRSVYLTGPRPQQGDPAPIALIPYLDLLNHCPHTDVKGVGFTPHPLVNSLGYVFWCEFKRGWAAAPAYDPEAGTFTLVSARGYRPGDQVFITYGAHDNLTLMLEYGFTLKDNPYDHVRLDLHVWYHLVGLDEVPISEVEVGVIRRLHPRPILKALRRFGLLRRGDLDFPIPHSRLRYVNLITRELPPHNHPLHYLAEGAGQEATLQRQPSPLPIKRLILLAVRICSLTALVKWPAALNGVISDFAIQSDGEPDFRVMNLLRLWHLPCYTPSKPTLEAPNPQPKLGTGASGPVQGGRGGGKLEPRLGLGSSEAGWLDLWHSIWVGKIETFPERHAGVESEALSCLGVILDRASHSVTLNLVSFSQTGFTLGLALIPYQDRVHAKLADATLTRPEIDLLIQIQGILEVETQLVGRARTWVKKRHLRVSK